MPQFYYKARSMLGQKVTGSIAVADEFELQERLRQNNLFLIEARKQERRKSRTLFGGDITRIDVISFTLHLATIFSSGLPLLEGLEALKTHMEKKSFQFVIEDLIEDIAGGASLSEALEKHPKAFSEVYVSMVRAAEVGGNMAAVLNSLVTFLEWQEALFGDIKRASTYPAVILVAVIGLVATLFTFSFPRILPIIISLKVELPLPTRLVIAISTFFGDFWYLFAVFPFFAFLVVKLLGKSPRGKLFLDTVKLYVPIFGPLHRKIALSRFAHHLSALLQSGVNITRSLSAVERVVGNAVIGRAIARAREKVLEGTALWYALHETGVFPPLVIRMVSMGETTGTLDETLGKVCQYYDQEVPASVKRFIAVFEPMLILMLAFLVVMSALALYLPLYDALMQIGKVR